MALDDLVVVRTQFFGCLATPVINAHNYSIRSRISTYTISLVIKKLSSKVKGKNNISTIKAKTLRQVDALGF